MILVNPLSWHQNLQDLRSLCAEIRVISTKIWQRMSKCQHAIMYWKRMDVGF